MRQAVKQALSSALPPRLWLTRGPRTAKCLSLTFDDGPDPVHTPRILAALREHGIQATFFMVGRQAAQHPELVQAIAAAGHEIGNHSFHHSEPRSTHSRQLVREIFQTRALLADLTGRATTLFRPPKGDTSFGKLLGTWRERHAVVLWNIDPRDYLFTNLEDALGWGRHYEPRGGDIVLLHDTRPFTADLIPLIAEQAAARNLGFVPVGTWVPGRHPVHASPEAALR